MGTSNFHYKNASKVFAICMNDYDNDEDNSDFEFEYDMSIEDIKECIETNLKDKTYSIKDIDNKRYRDCNELRSFPSYAFLSIDSKSKTFGDLELSVNFVLLARSGYYEGACIDFNIEMQINGYEVDFGYSLDYLMEDIDNHSNMNKGLQTIFMPKIATWFEKEKESLQNQIEEVLSTCTLCLDRIATFSNGETIYQKA